MISIVIPVYNEVDNLSSLHQRLESVLSKMGDAYEILFVDDGSKDGSVQVLFAIHEENTHAKILPLRRNVGQTAAMMTGIREAKGEIIITMDADLQNNPEDIPALLAKMAEGYDVVSGWRKNRQDSFISRVFVSRMANWIISRMTGVVLHDYGCTLKAYRSSILKGVRLYGEMHRFIPIYCHWRGAKIVEIEVKHSPRTMGESNYGLERIYKVVLDVLYLKFMNDYATKPIHFFGKLGLFSALGGFLAFVAVVVRKLYYSGDWISPLLIISFFMMGLGIVLVLIGIIAELLIRIYFELADREEYLINRDLVR